MDVLQRIEELRDARGWTNYRLAIEAGISQSSLNNLFRLNNQPRLATIVAICNGFGVTLSQFFAEDGETVTLTVEQRKMLDIWGAMSTEQKDALLEFIQKIVV